MKIIEHFFRILAPHDCIQCGSEGKLLCRTCAFKDLTRLPERCYRCYRLSANNKTCAICRHHTVLRYVWVRTPYENAAKKLIHSLKFTYARDAASVIAQELASSLPLYPADTVIVHVPAASSRIRLRGYDQSALIARELALLTGLRHMHMLRRRGQQRQVGSAQAIRREQMKWAFRPLASYGITGTRILLVDDVLTTGSTIESASRVLKEAGAKTIDAVVFAQAR